MTTNKHPRHTTLEEMLEDTNVVNHKPSIEKKSYNTMTKRKKTKGHTMM
jgi:hypothetical protein